MTKCTRRHLSSVDAGTLLRRALLTTTSPASQHPTEYLLSVALNAATGIVHAYASPIVDVLHVTNLRQAISVAATAMAWDPSHPLTDVVTRFSTPSHAEAWQQAEQEIDGILAGYPWQPGDPLDVALMRHRIIVGQCIANELCDAVDVAKGRHTTDDDLAELLEVLEGRLLVGDGPYAAMSAALETVPVPE
jgi:hypothetical protein